MADPTPTPTPGWEEEEAPKIKYMVLQRKSADELQRRVNKYINAQVDAQKYVPYWPMMIVDWTFYQVMVVASLAIYRLAWIPWTFAISGIWWTVNVSWCWWD